MREGTDGSRHRLYGPQDMVRIASSACAGCGACCRGMGDTIVLDPYDVWQLGAGLGKTFEELMGAGVDLHVEEGVILPHLMMRRDTQSCAFLGEDGRCVIHVYRPEICRLFPLGRQLKKKKTSYFIVRLLKARIAAEPSEEVRRNVNLYFVRVFFMAPYEGASSAEAFYREAADRMNRFTDAVL